MDQPITDYGAFLREARQAVAELNEMQQREGALNQQLNQSRRQLEAEEKAVADHISQTIKRRAADLASGYDKELNRGQERLRKAKSRREKAKSQGIKERISEETAPIREQNRQLKLQLKTVFQQNHVPAFCRSSQLFRVFVVCTQKAGGVRRVSGRVSDLFPFDPLWKLSPDSREEAFVSGADLFCMCSCVWRAVCCGG
jgi:DNA anti-recombination protein RmuC